MRWVNVWVRNRVEAGISNSLSSGLGVDLPLMAHPRLSICAPVPIRRFTDSVLDRAARGQESFYFNIPAALIVLFVTVLLLIGVRASVRANIMVVVKSSCNWPSSWWAPRRSIREL